MGVAFQEYLTGNEQVAYPFSENAPALVDHGSAVVHGPDARLPKDFLIDAVILTPSKFYGRVFLSEIVNAGGGVYEFYLFSEERRTVAAFSIPSVPPERSLLTFRDVATGVSVRLLTGPSFASFLSGVLTVDEFDGTLPFEAAAVEFRPQRVEKIIVDNTVPEEVTGDTVLLPGFNIDLELGSLFGFEESGLDVTLLRLDATPGAGAGKFNPCEDPPEPIDYIAKIAGVGPDEDGNVFFKAIKCHRFDLQPAAHTIYFYNDCEPCCECEDYAFTVEALDRLFERIREVKITIDDTIEQFNEHVTIYNEDLWQRFRSVFLTGNGHQGLSNDMGGLQKPKSGNYSTLTFHIANRSCVDVCNVRIKGTTDKEFEVVQRLKGKQAPAETGNTTSEHDHDLSLGTAVDEAVHDKIRAGADATIYYLLKRPFPEIASGVANVYVEYEVDGTTYETDPITVTW